LPWIQQTDSRRGHFVEQSLANRRSRPRLKAAQMTHPLVRRILDHIGIVFQRREPEQAIEIWRLLLGPNSQPFVVRIEPFDHAGFSLRTPSLPSPFHDRESTAGNQVER
jgi:hypothetical protein